MKYCLSKVKLKVSSLTPSCKQTTRDIRTHLFKAVKHTTIFPWLYFYSLLRHKIAAAGMHTGNAVLERDARH